MQSSVTTPLPLNPADPLARLLAAIIAFLRALLEAHRAAPAEPAPPAPRAHITPKIRLIRQSSRRRSPQRRSPKRRRPAALPSARITLTPPFTQNPAAPRATPITRLPRPRLVAPS